MKSRYWLVLIRVCALLAVLTSSALLMHYLAPEESGFCGARSGCEAVRKSALVRGLPNYAIPGLGVAGYIGVFWLSFYPAQRKFLRWAGAAGGVMAIGFIIHQALAIGSFCWMCLTVDGIAIVVAFACVMMTNVNPSPTPSAPSEHSTLAQWEPLRGWGWVLMLGVALNAPTIWVKVKPNEELPTVIEQLQEPGVLNVIEFADFECPHCRRLHPILRANVVPLGDKVKVQRFNVPLPFHPHAEGAARASVCGHAMGKGEAMDELLFEANLETDALFKHAAALGLDEAAFRNCLDAQSTTETLADHHDLFKAAKGHGLPLTFVGRETLRGSADMAMVRELFAKAQSPQPPRISGGLFLGLMVALVVAIALLFRRKSEAPPSVPAAA